jgi:hypothetical protein
MLTLIFLVLSFAEKKHRLLIILQHIFVGNRWWIFQYRYVHVELSQTEMKEIDAIP